MEKKRKDYVFLLIFMILSFLSISFVRKFYLANGDQRTLADILIGATTLGWYVFMYRTTSNFYSSKWFRACYLMLIIFQTIFNAYVHRDNHTAISSLIIPASIAYVANLAGLSLVFYILLKDIFLRKHDLLYSLLGATNIYFMIPIIFSYIYSLVAVHDPSLVHADPLIIRTLLFNCFDYSWYILAGIDFPEKFGEVIQSIAILESITGNLFIVFIIGRLMNK